MPDFGGGYSMNPQVAKMKGSAPVASPEPEQHQDPMADPDVQAAVQLLQQKGITPDQYAMACGEPDGDEQDDSQESGGEEEY